MAMDDAETIRRAFLRRRLALILNKSSSILPLSRVILISDVKMMRGKVVQLPPLVSPRKPQPNTESAVNMTLMPLAVVQMNFDRKL
jgi:hypothetical protein